MARRTSRGLAALFAAALVAALVVAACGAGEQKPADPFPPASPDPSPTASSSASPSASPGATDAAAVAAVRAAAQPLTGRADDYDVLLRRIGGARWVLIGEASHGTHDFYRERAEITRRLIEEKGFGGVAVEADWTDAYRVNRYVRGLGSDRSAADALRGFEGFPSWMWRNRDVLGFVDWLREWNARRPAERRVGFYGLDLYGQDESARAVVRHLQRNDRAAAARARGRYACLRRSVTDPDRSGSVPRRGAPCEREAAAQLADLRRLRASDAECDRWTARSEQAFSAEQNARVVRNAERYSHGVYQGPSWNVRDRHMAETLDALVGHLGRPGRQAKLVVWAHNTHVGDARGTEQAERGELTVGQLVRQRHPGESVHIGFTTYEGRVTAASGWGAPPELKQVRPALPESYEDLFHEVAAGRAPDFMLDLRSPGVRQLLAERRLERAIGVLYLPETERMSHYLYARLARQFDFVLHLDRTSAVVPLDPGEQGQAWAPEGRRSGPGANPGSKLQ